ncbi:MAG: RNA polymerase subunit sigma-24 [Planctomycetaceae bacterium]|nr:RNA polymerase subunit sigma-24 [Planctomycetaceae bacterium]
MLSTGKQDGSDADQTLSALCQIYWYPLYSFARRQGCDSTTAQDMTQGFFTHLLESRDFRSAKRERGRFRSFLLVSMRHFMLNEWEKQRAKKRGGDRVHVSLNLSDAESRYAVQPATTETAEAAFDREWALTLLEHVQSQLESEYADAGNAETFECLKRYLTTERQEDRYQDAADQLGISTSAVKSAVHRLRKRFRHILRAEIAQTVEAEADVDDELKSLFAALTKR